MARYINRVYIQGHVKGQVSILMEENQFTKQQQKLATVTFVVKNAVQRQDGTYYETTEFYRLVGQGENADYMEQHLRDGMPVVAAGTLRSSNVSDGRGGTRRVTDIFAEFVSATENERFGVPTTKLEEIFELSFNYLPTPQEYERAVTGLASIRAGFDNRANPFAQTPTVQDNRYHEAWGIPPQFLHSDGSFATTTDEAEAFTVNAGFDDEHPGVAEAGLAPTPEEPA